MTTVVPSTNIPVKNSVQTITLDSATRVHKTTLIHLHSKTYKLGVQLRRKFLSNSCEMRERIFICPTSGDKDQSTPFKLQYNYRRGTPELTMITKFRAKKSWRTSSFPDLELIISQATRERVRMSEAFHEQRKYTWTAWSPCAGHVVVGGNGGKDPLILNFRTRWKWVDRVTPKQHPFQSTAPTMLYISEDKPLETFINN